MFIITARIFVFDLNTKLWIVINKYQRQVYLAECPFKLDFHPYGSYIFVFTYLVCTPGARGVNGQTFAAGGRTNAVGLI